MKFIKDKVQFGDNLTDIDKLLLADAQTSGGLLISIPAEKAEKYISKFNELSEMKAAIVGEIVEKSNSIIFVK